MEVVWAYGLVAEMGKSSLTGTVAGSPYTVADEEKTMFLQPPLAMALSRLTVPPMLFSSTRREWMNRSASEVW